jgi:CubicO group peptidase (beta-lactamase class C family)
VREAPGFDPYKIQPDIDVIKTAFSLPLNSKPGDKYAYSNLGYYTLAEVIRSVSGKPWADFLNERVFAPLAMTSTRPTSVAAIILNRAGGYAWKQGPIENMENWTTGSPERRIRVDGPRHGEVGSGTAVGSNPERLNQEGHVDAGQA